MCFLRENHENTGGRNGLELSSETGSLLLEFPSTSKERQSGRLQRTGFWQALRDCVFKVIRALLALPRDSLWCLNGLFKCRLLQLHPSTAVPRAWTTRTKYHIETIRHILAPVLVRNSNVSSSLSSCFLLL